MKDIKYFEQKVENLKKIINMRECQLRRACDGLESIANEFATIDNIVERQSAKKALEAVDAIYDLHKGEKIENGFLGEPHKRG